MAIKLEVDTIAFRPEDQETIDTWKHEDFKSFYGFRTKMMSWFIKQVFPIIKQDKGKFYTALINKNLKLKIEYIDED